MARGVALRTATFQAVQENARLSELSQSSSVAGIETPSNSPNTDMLSDSCLHLSELSLSSSVAGMETPSSSTKPPPQSGSERSSCGTGPARGQDQNSCAQTCAKQFRAVGPVMMRQRAQLLGHGACRGDRTKSLCSKLCTGQWDLDAAARGCARFQWSVAAR